MSTSQRTEDSVSTMLTAPERGRVDAAGTGLYVATHRDSINEVIGDVRGRRAHAVVISVACCAGGSTGRVVNRVARIVRDFPRVATVALLTDADWQSPSVVLALGRSGVETLVDARQPTGWRSLREAVAHCRGTAGELEPAAVEHLSPIWPMPGRLPAVLRDAVHHTGRRHHRPGSCPHAPSRADDARQSVRARGLPRPRSTWLWRESPAPPPSSRTRPSRSPPWPRSRILLAAELRSPPRPHAGTHPVRISPAVRRARDARPVPARAHRAIRAHAPVLRPTGSASINARMHARVNAPVSAPVSAANARRTARELVSRPSSGQRSRLRLENQYR